MARIMRAFCMKEVLVVLFIFLISVCQAQKKQAAVWIIGEGCYLDFNNNPLRNQYKPTFGLIGVSTICDSNGVFQFSSSTQSVRNRNFVSMPNGGIGGANQSGGQFIIPSSDSAHLYRLFLIKGQALTSRTINMRLDSGLGNVDVSTIRTELNSVADHLACMLHANEKDSWVVGHLYNSDTLFALLVTKDGVVDTVYSKTFTVAKKPNYKEPFTTFGYDSPLKSSPDSRMLLVPRRTLEYPFHELYKFDRETGKFSDRLLIMDTVLPGNSPLFYNAFPDGAFSPDSRLLYTATGFRRALTNSTDGPGVFWQYSLEIYDSASIELSKVHIGKWDRFKPNKPEIRPYSPRLQLAMDGKIYISPGTSLDTMMSTIQCPNTKGVNCQLQIRSLNLHPTFPLPTDYSVRTSSFFPTLNQTFVRNAGIFQVQANKRKLCQGDTLELSGYGAGAEHFTWSVSPVLPQTVKVDTLTWQKIGTGTIPPGSYTFTCQSFSRCGDVFEKSLVVEILPLPQKPILFSLQKPVPCTGDSVILQVQNPQAGNRYFWSTGDSAASIVVKQTGLYSLDSVSNAAGCGIRVGDTVSVNIKNAVIPPVPVIAGPKVLEICEGQKAKLKVDSGQWIVKYRWSNGQEGDSIIVDSGQWTVNSETAEGCQSGSSDTVRVVEIPNPRPVFVNLDSVLKRETLSNQNYCVSGQAGSRFSFAVTGGQKVDSSENCITVQWIVDSGKWIVNATEVLNHPDCKGSVSQVFTYRPRLEIPNLITPNGDGKNDRLVIQDLEFYPNHHLQIFNRWGIKVLDSNRYPQDWTGPAGLYFYSLVVEGKQLNGWIEITN